MTVISNTEFMSHIEKYFNLAVSEDIVIERGENKFHLFCSNPNGDIVDEYDEILEPDEDFYRALSASEFRERLITVLEKVDKKYSNKCK